MKKKFSEDTRQLIEAVLFWTGLAWFAFTAWVFLLVLTEI
jgi:hypothetical protein